MGHSAADGNGHAHREITDLSLADTKVLKEQIHVFRRAVLRISIGVVGRIGGRVTAGTACDDLVTAEKKLTRGAQLVISPANSSLHTKEILGPKFLTVFLPCLSRNWACFISDPRISRY